MQNTTRFKIWVCEYISAGGLVAEALPASLLQEGLLMRDALLADLAALGMDCITSHDYRVMPPAMAQSVAIQAHENAHSVWQQQLAEQDIDACWVIAPETQGILQALCHLVQDMGIPWVGCTAQAIADTTSKACMAELCHQAGVPVVPHVMLAELTTLESLSWYGQGQLHGWVVKPDDGAGCTATYYFKKDSELIEFKNNLINNSLLSQTQFLLQPYVPGIALSMSVVATANEVKVIAAHRQQVEIVNGEFTFNGAGVNEATDQILAMQRLAEQVHRAIPGLIGYWGADMILNAAGALVLVEINPRLTTPYIGLSRIMNSNPAGVILQAVLNNQLQADVASSSLRLTLNTLQEGGYDQV